MVYGLSTVTNMHLPVRTNILTLVMSPLGRFQWFLAPKDLIICNNIRCTAPALVLKKIVLSITMSQAEIFFVRQ